MAANVVEGSARQTTREWLNFLNIAAGSATEANYLAHVAGRLGFVEEQDATALEQGYSELAAGLRAMSRALREKIAGPSPGFPLAVLATTHGHAASVDGGLIVSISDLRGTL